MRADREARERKWRGEDDGRRISEEKRKDGYETMSEEGQGTGGGCRFPPPRLDKLDFIIICILFVIPQTKHGSGEDLSCFV